MKKEKKERKKNKKKIKEIKKIVCKHTDKYVNMSHKRRLALFYH